MTDPNTDFAITVSPTTLLDTNRYVCEVCYKGFPRKQNLTLHRRVHNLPFTLKTRTSNDPMPKKVYICPEPTCVHHNRSHGLGDFGGLRKHYLRKHCTQKNFKCDKCCKAYTVETDLKAHLKICGRKRKYTCRCGCCFSRVYDFNLHQENCDKPENVGAAKYPQTLQKEKSSVEITRNDNSSSSSSHIGSIMSHPTTLGMGDDSMRFNTQTSSIQNASNSYHSIEPYQYSDIDFYADLLTDKVPLQNLNLEGSNSFSDGNCMFDSSSPLNFTPVMHDTNQSGMLNPMSGVSYEHGIYYGYESGQFETSAGAVAPSEPQLHQYGFWF